MPIIIDYASLSKKRWDEWERRQSKRLWAFLGHRIGKVLWNDARINIKRKKITIGVYTPKMVKKVAKALDGSKWEEMFEITIKVVPRLRSSGGSIG